MPPVSTARAEVAPHYDQASCHWTFLPTQCQNCLKMPDMAWALGMLCSITCVQLRVRACRKFDIRQWVLVTSSAPMTAWFYQECYLRFCAEDYSLSDLTNVFSHLSNNCIARKSLHFQSGLPPLPAADLEASDLTIPPTHLSTHPPTHPPTHPLTHPPNHLSPTLRPCKAS